MELALLLLSGLAAFIVYKLVAKLADARSLPPGPLSLPIIGSYLSLKFPLKHWHKAAKDRYGPISSFNFNHRFLISLNTYEAVKEAFVNQGATFSGRPTHLFATRIFENSGLVMNEGPLWREHRRFSLQTLRDFGFGKNASEESITKEAEELMEALEATKGKPVSSGNLFGKAVSNVICRLVFGRRVATEDPSFDEKLSIINKITQDAPQKLTFTSAVIMPLYLTFAPEKFMQLPRLQQAVKLFYSVFDYCQGHIDRKRENFEPTDEPNDYIEAYLAERHRIGEQRGQEEASRVFGDKKLQVSISDLFVAGTDTTSNSLRWLALHFGIDPELQQRLQKYVDDKIGHRMPNMNDKQNLPLVESVLLESMRYYTLVPVGVQHKALEEANLMGYRIPKNACVFPNLHVIHFDPENFNEPHKFNADRFLDSSGKFVPSERVIPFLIGKRSCLGESLARMEFFLFAVILLQNFTIRLPESERKRLPEILEGTGGTVCAPGEHQLIFEKRD